MFFYIDESGHTGPNLFDSTQPMLYYGVLSSRVNVNILAEDQLNSLRKRCGVPRLHAAELGNGGLVKIIQEICSIQKKLDIRFDIYRVAKPDHAVISFFDQVFDHGLNPAVTWTGYWTPLRYVLLLKVASLFDDETARNAWDARIEIDDAKAESTLISVCRNLRERIESLPDARSRQLIFDALTWAEKNPTEIHYNTKSKKDRLSVMPNIIGFQSVMHGIAARLNKHKKTASQIIVDQQSQFNKAQRTLADFFASARGIPFVNGPGLPKIDFKGMPNTPITFSSSLDSAGLELVDIHLWIFKRIMEKKDVAPELYSLVKPQLHRGRTDEISIKAIASRWSKWFKNLPDPTEEQLEKGKEILAIDENRRLRAVNNNT